MKEEGAVQNLDFTGVIAITTGECGKLFFAGVFDGVVTELSYREEGKTIIIGHVDSEDEHKIQFDHALEIKPLQMRKTHEATNDLPLDCCRRLLHDVRELHPQSLGPFTVSKARVLERIELVNT